jgi:serine/threonine protein kinase
MFHIDNRYLDHPYLLEDCLINPVNGTIIYDQIINTIRRKELELLDVLICANGKLVSRNELIDELWNGHALVGEPGLNRLMADLRKTIHDNDKSKPIIRTITRKGYQLNGSVKDIEDTSCNSLKIGESFFDDEWRLMDLVSKTDVSETWLAKSINESQTRIFRFCLKEKHLQRLRKEVDTLKYLKKSLSKVDEIITIESWQLDEPPYFLEIPTTKFGSLQHWSNQIGSLIHIPHSIRLGLMVDIAKAIAAIHQLGMVHKNLQPSSVFIDDDEGSMKAKLGEFGLSECNEVKDQVEVTTNRQIITSSGEGVHLDYQAPETIAHCNVFEASDVYAFGVLLYQMMSGNLNRQLVNDWHLDITDKKISLLIRQCVVDNPQERISASKVLTIINKIANPDMIPIDDKKTTLETIDTNIIKHDQANKENEFEKTIGHYHLIEKLGEGGMGVVYLAEQRKPIHRQVALKLIKTEAVSDLSVARFESERQTLAIMNHDNVASVLDVGQNKRGQPYFVMEYVPGEKISIFCDKNKLNIQSRIKLFLQVCQGVLHAHQKGVIHRDINPNNILVKTVNLQDPVVKIIDFGVAKSLQRNITDAQHTQIGVFVGTLQYASPEQIEGSKSGIDTRSDVYSLGVLLYELLAGITPYEPSDKKVLSSIELIKLITDQSIPKLSNKIISLTNSAQIKIAENRCTQITKLCKSLDNELTWIALKCLEPVRENRYGSVLELINDLKRFINNKPVEARKANKLYYIKKFYKRHTKVSLIVSFLAISLLASSFIAYSEYLIAQNAFKESEALVDYQANQLKRAKPFLIGKSIKKQLLNYFETNDSVYSTIEQKTEISEFINQMHANVFTNMARDHIFELILEPSINSIQEDYNDHPMLQAKLYYSLSGALFDITHNNLALEAIDKSIDILDKNSNQKNSQRYKAYKLRGSIKHDLSRLTEAMDDFKLAYDGNMIIHGENNRETLSSYYWLGAGFYRMGNYDEAYKIISSTLEKQKSIFGPEDKDIIASMAVLGNIYLRTGKYQQAKKHIRKTYELTLKRQGEVHHLTLMLKVNLAVVDINLGDYVAAIIKLREVIKIRMKLHGEKNYLTITTQNFLARALIANGKYPEGIAISSNVLEKSKISLKSPNIVELNAKHNLGQALFLIGELEQAEKFIQLSIKGRTELFGTKHLDTNKSILVLADIRIQQNNFKEAKQLYKKPLEFYLNNYGKEHDRYLQIRNKYDLISAK